MPKLKIKGKVKHFAYTPKGQEEYKRAKKEKQYAKRKK